MRGEHESGAELLERLDGLEALGSIGVQRLARRCEQVGIGAVMRAADAATQLVQLRQSEPVGAIDHDGVGRGHVDAAFDDGGAHQQVEAPMVEIDHEPLEVPLAHLAMAHAHIRLGNEPGDFLRGLVDGLDHVVHEVHLAAAPEFAQRRLAQRGRVPLGDESLDRQPLGRRRGDQRQVAQAARAPC